MNPVTNRPKRALGGVKGNRRSVMACVGVAGLLVMGGCDAKGSDRAAAVVQGHSISRGLVEELASLESVGGQPQAPLLTPAGLAGDDVRLFLGQVITLEVAANELEAVGYERPAELVAQVEEAYPAEAFQPRPTEAFRRMVIDLIANSEWTNNPGEEPEGAAELLLKRHPELARQTCFDALVVTELEADSYARQLEHIDLSEIEAAQLDQCMPIDRLQQQPASIRRALESGRVSSIVGPIEESDGVNMSTLWLRPRGTEVMPEEEAIGYASSLLADPPQLGAIVASLPGEVSLASEFADGLTASQMGAILAPAGVSDVPAYAATVAAQNAPTQDPAAQQAAAQQAAADQAATADPATQDPATQDPATQDPATAAAG